MAQLTQVQKIIELLRNNPGRRFNAKEIAKSIVSKYPDDYKAKRENPRFVDDNAFLSQVVAEIGARKSQILRSDKHVFWQDRPRPRLYWYDPESEVGEEKVELLTGEDTDPEEGASITITQVFTEHDLYPILIQYLKSEHQLYCKRIDEKRSKNQRGTGGNQWLHPDIVAMQLVDKDWHDLVKTCVQKGKGVRVRLWSFEVKKELSVSNVRMSFFQAVSNSSWANEGYLVTTGLSDSRVEQELRMLSALHGIGLILLDPQNPSESEILLPAKARTEIDWQSVNRIVVENEDFNDYIELVSTYYAAGRARSGDWH
jgi:uncharacterized protein